MSSSILNFIKTNKKQSNPVDIPAKNSFNFGKYKGETYDEVFEKDKEYVCWVLGADPKYYSKIQNYYKKLIETST